MHTLVNGSHFSHVENYFEWWYFHFASSNGFAANIVLHETDIFGLSRSPYVSMSYQTADSEPKYLRRAIPSESIVRGSELLSQTEGIFEENNDSIKIHLSFQSGETFDVVIAKLTEPLTLNNGVLYQEGDKRSYWGLQVPFGHFTGVLKTKEENYPAEGVVYHDHQWGNISIQDFVSDWVWGHFSSNETSAVFFAIQTQGGELIERYTVVLPSGVQSATIGGQVSHLKELAESDNPNLWSGEPVVTFPFGITLKTTVNPNSLLRARVNEVSQGFTSTYLRWVGDAIVSPSNRLHYGITEYIRIRRE